jgi:hypothetical protein
MVVFAGSAMLSSSACGGRGNLIDSWETRSSAFQVRVRHFDERHPGLLPHYYFSFEARAAESNQWKEVMAWKVDDPIPIQRQQVRFVTDSILYAFGNAKYVVTTDSGKTWAEWDAKKAMPNPEAYMIDKVVVSADGTGSMVVRRSTSENNGRAELATIDFGVHWTLKNAGPQAGYLRSQFPLSLRDVTSRQELHRHRDAGTTRDRRRISAPGQIHGVGRCA